jgi:hypothetical protein
MEDPLIDQFVDRAPWFERRVELGQRLGPEQARVELRLDLLSNERVLDLNEAANIRGVGREQLLAQLEDVHGLLPQSRALTGTPIPTGPRSGRRLSQIMTLRARRGHLRPTQGMRSRGLLIVSSWQEKLQAPRASTCLEADGPPARTVPLPAPVEHLSR